MHKRLFYILIASGLLWLNTGLNVAFAAMSLAEADKVIEACDTDEGEAPEAAKVDAAIAVYKAKAEKGDVATQLKLADIYNNGFCTTDEDGKQAMLWYSKAATAGNVEAQSSLANLYYNQEDFTNAALWYNKAAAQMIKMQPII